MSYLITLLDTIQRAISKTTFICGDMNINLADTCDTNEKYTLINWMLENNLVQIVKENTRHRVVNTRNGERIETLLIDHIYTNDKNRILKVCQIETGYSDHELISFKFKLDNKVEPLVKTKVRDWRKYTKERLIKWTTKYSQIQGVGPLDVIFQVLEKLAPYRVIRFRDNMGQLVNTRVEKKKKKRNMLFIRYKKTGNIDDLKSSKAISREIKKLVKKEKERSVKLKAETPNVKTFWNMVNKILGKSYGKSTKLMINGNIEVDPLTIGRTFRDFFIGKVLKLADLERKPIILGSIEENQNPLVFTKDELRDALRKLKNKKCYGVDNIPLKMAKDYATLYENETLEMLNQVSKNGMSETWKTARILPLHKKGDKLEVENYRPISNLVSFSKIYEKIVLSRLEQETKGLEGTWQHGFRNGHSTVTAALELQSIICHIVDRGKIACVYSVDLSAAFDLLRVDTLLETISSRTTISGGLKHILIDFLTERKMMVEVDNIRTDAIDLPIGCVQGSILGPRLFTIYCGGLKDAIGAENFVCYADDSYVVIEGSGVDEIKAKTESISKKHVVELHKLGMVVNTSKSEVVIFSKKPIITDVIIGDALVKTKTDMKVLGIIFDAQLKWETHVKMVLSKCNSKLSMLRKIRGKFKMHQFLKIITTQFFSHLYFCSTVWLSSETRWNLKKLINTAHYKALRITLRDNKNIINRDRINKMTKRCTPK